MDTQKINKKNNKYPKTNISAFENKKNQKKYQEKINEDFEYEANQNTQEKWNKITKVCIDKVKETLGKSTKYQKHNDEEIQR